VSGVVLSWLVFYLLFLLFIYYLFIHLFIIFLSIFNLFLVLGLTMILAFNNGWAPFWCLMGVVYSYSKKWLLVMYNIRRGFTAVPWDFSNWRFWTYVHWRLNGVYVFIFLANMFSHYQRAISFIFYFYIFYIFSTCFTNFNYWLHMHKSCGLLEMR